jgi:hypothetical protein
MRLSCGRDGDGLKGWRLGLDDEVGLRIVVRGHGKGRMRRKDNIHAKAYKRGVAAETEIQTPSLWPPARLVSTKGAIEESWSKLQLVLHSAATRDRSEHVDP